MKCDFSFELLSGYVDNELTEEQKALVDSHLKTCKFCQEQLEELRIINETIKSRPIEEPSREFIFTLSRRVIERVRKKERSLVWLLKPVLIPVAVAFLIFVVLLNIERPMRAVSINDRVLYGEVKFDEVDKKVELQIPEPSMYTPKAGAVTSVLRETRIKSKATTPAAEMAREEAVKVSEARDKEFVQELEIPMDRVVRAIVDSTGKIVKVATGNTIMPQKDTMLENRLTGQQLASPPTIAGRRAQMYVDLTPSQEDTSLHKE